MSTTIGQIQTSLTSIRAARERIVQHRTTGQIIQALATTASRWLDPASPWRKRATAQVTGFSKEMISEAIDLTFSTLTAEAFGELLDGELGDRRVRGPALVTHILSGNVPHPGIVSICLGLLLKSANLVKLSSRDPLLPELFVESLREVDAQLADCVVALEWKREEQELTSAALAGANAVIAYGDDATIASIRALSPANAIFLGYGHKFSLGVVAREAMTQENMPALAEFAAFDVSVYDQQGCLSPHMFFIEEGGELGPQDFAAALAEAMATYQQRVPRGRLSTAEAAEIASIRARYEFRVATDDRVRVWASPGTNDWTVIYLNDPAMTASCLNRTVYVKPAKVIKHLLDTIKPHVPKISTVGVAPTNKFATELSKLGIARVCPIGQMQRPPLTWQHDGRPNIADLVRWTNEPGATAGSISDD